MKEAYQFKKGVARYRTKEQGTYYRTKAQSISKAKISNKQNLNKRNKFQDEKRHHTEFNLIKQLTEREKHNIETESKQNKKLLKRENKKLKTRAKSVFML